MEITFMSKMSKNLLNELLETHGKLTESIVKTRADHTINSTINFLQEVEDKYGDDVASLLEKRLLAAIKNRNASRFKMSKISEMIQDKEKGN